MVQDQEATRASGQRSGRPDLRCQRTKDPVLFNMKRVSGPSDRLWTSLRHGPGAHSVKIWVLDDSVPVGRRPRQDLRPTAQQTSPAQIKWGLCSCKCSLILSARCFFDLVAVFRFGSTIALAHRTARSMAAANRAPDCTVSERFEPYMTSFPEPAPRSVFRPSSHDLPARVP
jgi:hypothetical protein